jgi:hypothetical protein
MTPGEEILEQRKEQVKRIQSMLDQYSIYHHAPDMLCESMMELSKILVNHKARAGEDVTYIKFKSIADSMLHAFNYINDLAFIYSNHKQLMSEIATLREMYYNTNAELMSYKIIENEMMRGSLQDKTKVITEKINRNT